MTYSPLRKLLTALMLCIVPIAAFAEFGTVNFKFDFDQLDAEGQQQILEIAEQLKNYTGYEQTVIIGFTDAVGSLGYNADLGFRRATTVANALRAAGVPENRISSISSKGKTELLVQVATANRQNRRVTVTLSDILAACRSYRDINITKAGLNAELREDLLERLSEAKSSYEQFTASGANGPAFQMAGAAREDCGHAVGLDDGSVRKVEYAQRCVCSSVRLRTALGGG